MPEYLENDGIWCQVMRPQAAEVLRGRAALFLDRDGVVVEEVGYLHRPEDVRLIPGVGETVAAMNRGGVPVVLITNQSGIGRGLYGWPDFAVTQDKIAQDMDACGGAWDMVVACPFHPEGVPPYQHPAHPCRKPRPGMILRAAERLSLDLASSWVVGDRAIDLEAGRAAGLRGGGLALTGQSAEERPAVEALAGDDFEVRLIEDIGAVPQFLPLLEPRGH